MSIEISERIAAIVNAGLSEPTLALRLQAQRYTDLGGSTMPAPQVERATDEILAQVGTLIGAVRAFVYAVGGDPETAP